jgi:hypothetical protein
MPLNHGANSFTSPPKEGILRIFIVFKNSPLAGFEPMNLESSGKHTNCYTTEDDQSPHTGHHENLKSYIVFM